MQVLHVAMACGAVFLVAWQAPASRPVRAAAALGYFPIYEYGTIARNYAAGMLLLAAFCALFPRRREHPLAIGVVLFLLANTSLPACVLAMAALGALALDASGRPRPSRPAATWTGIGLGAAGVAASAWQMLPPSDSGFAVESNFSMSWTAMQQVLATVPEAFLPLPVPGAGFWQSSLLGTLPGYSQLGWILAIPLLGVFALALARRPVAFVYFLLGSLGLLLFFYVKTLGYLRHHGFLFLSAGTALWLARSLPPSALSGRPGRWVEGAERIAPALFGGLLAIHLVAAGIAVAGDASLEFSGGKAAAALIRDAGLERLPLVADRDYMSMAVVGYLEKDRALFPAGRRPGSYVVWDRARYQRFDVWGQAVGLALSTQSAVVVLLDAETVRARPPPPQLRPVLRELGCVTAGVVVDESFCVYVLGEPGR